MSKEMELKVKIAGDEAMRAQFRCSVPYDGALNYSRQRSHFLKNLFLKTQMFLYSSNEIRTTIRVSFVRTLNENKTKATYTLQSCLESERVS